MLIIFMGISDIHRHARNVVKVVSLIIRTNHVYIPNIHYCSFFCGGFSCIM